MIAFLSTDSIMEAVESPLNNFFFPTKLWQLVNDTKICAIIWNSQGNGIIIRQDLIERQVLSLDSFRATSFPSFVRQLHYYGFKKSNRWRRDKPRIHHFTHPNFIRNHPELLSFVRRFPRRRWCTARANTACQPKFLRRYGAVGPPYFCNVPRMPAESYHMNPNPHHTCHPIQANPNMFHLHRFVVSGEHHRVQHTHTHWQNHIFFIWVLTQCAHNLFILKGSGSYSSTLWLLTTSVLLVYTR